MEQVDFVIRARWIIPVEPAGVVLEDHSMAVRDGRILAILPNAELEARYAPEVSIDRPEHALLPGLINAHTHSAMTLFRGMADDMPLERWLGERIWPAESRWASPDFVRDGAHLAMAEMLRSGTTCFQDMYFFPDIVAQSAVERHIRAVIGMIVIEMPTAWAETTDEYLTKGIAVHDQYKGHPLVSTSFAPHAPYTISDETCERLRMLANELDVPVHMHVHETAEEIATAISEHGRRPLARLAELSLVNPLLTAVHMTQLDDVEIEQLATAGVSVVHCPESNLKLASGLCPVARLLEAGVNVALGTDGAASNNDLDMFGEMRTAALLGKMAAGDAGALSATTVLQMATLNGARALGIGDETGSLISGKYADMICVNLSEPATQPVYNPVSQIVYSAGRDQVTDTWVGGRQRLADRQLIGTDLTDILDRASAWQQRIAASLLTTETTG